MLKLKHLSVNWSDAGATYQPLCSLHTKELNPQACTSVGLLGPCFKTGQSYSYYPQVHVKAGEHAQQAKQHPHIELTQHTRHQTHTHTPKHNCTHAHANHIPPQADCHSHTMISKSKRASTPSKSHCVCMHARPIVKHTRTTISFRKPKHVHFLFSQCKLVDAPFLNVLFIFLTWYLCTIRPKHLSTCACNLPPNLHSSAKECDSTHIHRAQSCT